MSSKPVRRMVTGLNEAGRAVISMDGELPTIVPLKAVPMVDEGETRLGPGDIVIQRGTNHAWSNRTEQPARIAFVLLDGKFALG